jgi:formylglycine-generating enzyme required for sulfatase activity
MNSGKRVSAIAALSAALVLASTALAEEFQDCEDCPVMVALPAGEYVRSLFATAPQQQVSVGAFALGRYEVTIAEFEAFVEDTGYEIPPGCLRYNAIGMLDAPDATFRQPGFPLPPDAPALCVTWDDANAYVEWLSAKTGQSYRLPSEAEWDYAAHAGQENNLSYFLRAGLARLDANCSDCAGDLMGREDLLRALPVGTFAPNAFGIDVIFGNAAEWVADCYNSTYEGAPTNGDPWLEGNCDLRIVRGGGWHTLWAELAGGRPATDPAIRDNAIGFRVARDLD